MLVLVRHLPRIIFSSDITVMYLGVAYEIPIEEVIEFHDNYRCVVDDAVLNVETQITRSYWSEE